MRKSGMKFLLAGIFILLVACGKKEKEPEQVLNVNIGPEPKTIDPQLNTGSVGSIVINNLFEGLLRRDKEGKLNPAMAASYEISSDKLQYTFKLKDDVKWSDGKPVKAQDFVYSWTRALDPKVGSQYSFLFLYLKNGRAFFDGKGKKEDVGVKALDDKTLQVTLESPTPFFLGLTAFPSYMPVRKDIVEQKPEGWAKDPSLTVSNGPFILKEWKTGDRIVLEPNTNYWNAGTVRLKRINMLEINDASTALTAYENGELDINGIVPSAEIPRLRNEDPNFTVLPSLATYYYEFNVTKPPLDNVLVRKALSLSINRKDITEKVLKNGQVPAAGFVPPGIEDSQGRDFQKTAGDYGISPTGNIEEAKKYLADAGYPDGKGFPELTILYNTSESHKAIAEAIQEMWKKNLNINVKLTNQEWKVFLSTKNEGNFEIGRAGWIGDYIDPATFLEVTASFSGNNDTQWDWKKHPKVAASNKQYDDFLEKAKMTSGVERDTALYNAEKLLMKEAVIMPIYYYTGLSLIRKKVKNWYTDATGKWYYGATYIDTSEE